MANQISQYLMMHPDFWMFLKEHPQYLQQLLLCPEDLELLKMKFKEQKNNQWILKIQNIGMLLRMMEMTNG